MPRKFFYFLEGRVSTFYKSHDKEDFFQNLICVVVHKKHEIFLASCSGVVTRLFRRAHVPLVLFCLRIDWILLFITFELNRSLKFPRQV